MPEHSATLASFKRIANRLHYNCSFISPSPSVQHTSGSFQFVKIVNIFLLTAVDIFFCNMRASVTLEEVTKSLTVDTIACRRTVLTRRPLLKLCLRAK